jgi:hypothetical protein
METWHKRGRGVGTSEFGCFSGSALNVLCRGSCELTCVWLCCNTSTRGVAVELLQPGRVLHATVKQDWRPDCHVLC